MIYHSRQNDILDDVVFRYYGDTDRGIVEDVLEANRAISLGDYPPELPEGVLIELPDRAAEAEANLLTRLWD